MRHRRQVLPVVMALLAGLGVAPADEPATGSPDRARELTGRAFRLYQQGKYAEGVPVAREALALREAALGGGHVDVAESLNLLAMLLQQQGDVAEARALYERALAISEAGLGPAHVQVGVALNNLAVLVQAQGDLKGARPLFERALSILEKSLAEDHELLGNVVSNLSDLLRAEGALAEARRMGERALAIKERRLGADHPSVAVSLNNLALLLQDQGALADARALLERAIRIREAALGPGHPDTAHALSNLAGLLQRQGAYAEAEDAYGKSLAIYERALGGDHPAVAGTLTGLGVLRQIQGDHAEARALFERALGIRERALGPEHPEVVQSISCLAGLLRETGSYEEARRLYDRAIRITERAVGAEHPVVATLQSYLGEVLLAQGAVAEARELHVRTLALRERLLGKEHPDVATSLINVALALRREGACAEARAHLERAIAVRQATLGADHPFLGIAYNNMGALLWHEGALEEAKSWYERARAVEEGLFGPDHPRVADSLANVALLLQKQGRTAEGRPLLERALRIDERLVRAQFAGLDPAARRSLLATTRDRLANWLVLAGELGETGYAEVLRFKGIVARSEAAERALVRHATDEERRMQEELRSAEKQVARLAHEVPPARRKEARIAWQRRYAEAEAVRRRLTQEFSVRVAPLRAALERMDLGLADVQARLARDDALVDFLFVGGACLAWVVRREGEARRLELAPAERVDAACRDFVSAVLGDAGDAASAAAIRERGSSLSALVWAPVERALGKGVSRVILCPDGALGAVPWAALPGREPGRWLLDELRLVFVTQAQDLVPPAAAPRSGRGALLVGGVNFDRADGPSGGPSPRRSAVPEAPPAPGGFAPLPGTLLEVEALRALLPREEATLLVGPAATESRIREAAKARRTLHLATHGFAREDLRAGLSPLPAGSPALSVEAERRLAAGHDPMLLSGLAMAGANVREGGLGDDGILTALEASYLDLEGVDLVTLSACETARGAAASGEGVVGLASAFALAGAGGVLASLWQVDDEATRLLMEGVYGRLWRPEDPLGPAEALREAAIALRDSKDAGGRARFAAPRHWAAFVAYGK